MRTSLIAFVATISAIMSAHAEPIEYVHDGITARVSGYGNVGMIEQDFTLKNSSVLGDWSLRGQLTYDADDTHRLGFVYSLNQQTIDEDSYVNDLFALWQIQDVGRIEFGLTDSVAEKMGLGLPDVGGLRMNDNPLVYKKIKPDGAIIADTILDTGDSDVRINLVSAVYDGVQYGVSGAAFGKDYDFTVDGAIKIRRPHGKTKAAYAFGASFMSRPDGFSQSPYSPKVTADWRAQFSAAMNLQYNSLVFGLSGRVIYDENPVGAISDGIIVGTGVSYDLLKYTVSLSYLFSDTGIWHDVDDYQQHTVVSSFRYKYSEYVDGWMSVGWVPGAPFVSAGLRITF
ncbi:MAG: hypothetical protein J5679_00670 [Alphaproteobacteria bacterium]|nr:hypothetical protein [Alphaproteobacteria bacterium]